MGFTREQLEASRDASVPDLIGDDVRLLFVGINPGLWAAATQTHFAHPGNRFYPALVAAGITRPFSDPPAGLTAEEQAHLRSRGVAITNLVARATSRAAELSREEMVAGGRRLVARLETWQPAAVAVLGLAAYRTAFDRPNAVRGEQAKLLASARTFVSGSPSGLNAHDTVDSLAAAFREAARAAGIDPYPPSPAT